MKYLLTLLFALIATGASAQSVDNEVVVEVGLNELVSLSVSQECDESRWVGGDLSSTHHQVDATSGTLYLVAKRNCEVLLVMVCEEGDQRLVIYRYKILVGDSPEPPPEPEPSPEPSEEFDGDNTYGLGKIAYDASRAISREAKDKAIVQIDTGIKRLQGVGGILFISSPNSRDSIFKYMRDNLDDWCDPVIDAMEAKKNDPLRLKDWLNMLNEVKAGVNYE